MKGLIKKISLIIVKLLPPGYKFILSVYSSEPEKDSQAAFVSNDESENVKYVLEDLVSRLDDIPKEEIDNYLN